ncbi:MAG: 50S ribosomal protein L1 [Deltaproteobacteria bacterium]|nr:50S ribosomal protein L1 [Deltaproteobacteria bacterium]
MSNKLGKKRTAAFKRVDRTQRYKVADAMKLVKGCKTSKFDEAVDVAINLSVDPRHADQMVRGAVVMPHGTGKSIRVAVFAKGPKAKEAQDAGADIVGADDLHDRIAGGFMDFDQVIATPDMMGVVGKLGRVLGPRGLMPNPKVGTVTMDVAKAVRESKAGKVEYKVEKAGIVHASLGKVSMDSDKLTDNFNALFENILRQKPASAKGIYVKNVVVSSTMGPGVKVDIADATAMASVAVE